MCGNVDGHRMHAAWGVEPRETDAHGDAFAIAWVLIMLAGDHEGIIFPEQFQPLTLWLVSIPISRQRLISVRISLAARLIGTCEYVLRRGRPTRPASVSRAADPDDQQRSNLKARLGVRQPMAVDIFLTIRWIIERTHDEHISEQCSTRRRNGPMTPVGPLSSLVTPRLTVRSITRFRPRACIAVLRARLGWHGQSTCVFIRHARTPRRPVSGPASGATAPASLVEQRAAKVLQPAGSSRHRRPCRDWKTWQRASV